MSSERRGQLRKRYRLWSGLLSAAALVILTVAGSPIQQSGHLLLLLGLGLVALLAELLLIRYPLWYGYTDRGIWMSVSTPIVTAVILLYGWQLGAWLDALVTFGAGLLTARLKQSRLRWVWLNTAQSVLCAAGAGAWHPIAGISPIESALASPLSAALILLSTLVMYSLINTFLVSITVALAEGVRLRWVLHESLLNLPRETLPTFPLSLLLMAMLHLYGFTGLLAVLAPYLALRQAFILYTRQHELYHQTVRSLGFLIQRAHPYTGGHLQRVAQWGRKVAERLGLPPERCELVYEAALLHDLGKTVLDERILNKPGRLTPREWEQVQRHPQLGAEILISVPFLNPIVPWIAYHHERPDGKGYPYGLQGDQIPLEARIIAVVDAFDAMIGGEAPSQQRQYRRALSIEDALKELRRGAGTQFDPTVVSVFEQVVQEWLPLSRTMRVARSE
ncbi:3'3'-cGAMP-specific phosphodiesterase 3 [bacterium HR15]|nr:3'3'-cGAMP-specific phosphodiesterase 3 [bacterium HR15]